MKLKKKPAKPVRKKNIELRLTSLYFDQLPIDELEDHIWKQVCEHQGLWFEKYDITRDTFSSIYVKRETVYNYDHDSDELVVYGTHDEFEYEFNGRVAAYTKRLKDYNTWFRQNRDAVEEYTTRRDKEKAEKAANKKQVAITALEKKLQKLKKC